MSEGFVLTFFNMKCKIRYCDFEAVINGYCEDCYFSYSMLNGSDVFAYFMSYFGGFVGYFFMIGWFGV